MQILILFSACFALASAQANKDKFDQTICDLGLTFFTKAEVAKMTKCMEDYFYNETSMDGMKDAGMKCVMNNCPFQKYSVAMDLMNKMNTCLKPIPEKTMDLVDKVTPAVKQIVGPWYTNVMNVIKKAKADKKTKAQVTDAGYAALLKLATRAAIDQVCTDLFKNRMNKIEVNCALSIGPKAVNVNGYSCAKIVKA